MSDALRGNPIALRSCILYDFLLEKPADESYESLCSVVGSDALPREEFDFWLNRFGNGNFALEFEFSDLPTDVLKVIIEKLELNERFILRKVSHGLRSLVDQVRPNFKLLQIHLELNHIWLSDDNTEITYAGPNFERKPNDTSIFTRYLVIDEDYRKVCIEDLKILLTNPKLKLERLIVSSYLKPEDTIQNASKFYEDFGRLLKSFDHQCHVEHLDILIYKQNEVLSILSCLKPRVLNYIRLSTALEDDDPLQLLRIDKLTKTEQWKHAEVVDIEQFKIQEPMESFYHLRRFDATWNRVTSEMLTGLRDALLKSVNFEYCCIYEEDGIEDVERIMGSEKIDDETLIYSIPNSANYLETGFDGRGVYIEKMSKD